jgi:hypothetical protein
LNSLLKCIADFEKIDQYVFNEQILTKIISSTQNSISIKVAFVSWCVNMKFHSFQNLAWKHFICHSHLKMQSLYFNLLLCIESAYSWSTISKLSLLSWNTFLISFIKLNFGTKNSFLLTPPSFLNSQLSTLSLISSDIPSTPK